MREPLLASIDTATPWTRRLRSRSAGPTYVRNPQSPRSEACNTAVRRDASYLATLRAVSGLQISQYHKIMSDVHICMDRRWWCDVRAGSARCIALHALAAD